MRSHGKARGQYLLERLEAEAQQLGIVAHVAAVLGLPQHDPARAPGRRTRATSRSRSASRAIMRWNALAMVVRANQAYGELGGHIASYASAAEIFEVGFNHFFRAAPTASGGDLVFFQPHSAPGVYARAFLEGRLTRASRPLPPGESAATGCARIRIPG